MALLPTRLHTQAAGSVPEGRGETHPAARTKGRWGGGVESSEALAPAPLTDRQGLVSNADW